MPEPRRDPGHETDLSRRDFLARRLPGWTAGLFGGGAAVAPSPTTAEAAPSGGAGSFAPRDLTRISRDGVKAALARIRAQRRGP